MMTFDRVARAYRWLEYAAFGRALQRARVAHLAALRDCRHILVVGDGDGRCVEVLAATAPRASIHCIDASAVMLALAKRRVPEQARERVTFEQLDVRVFTPARSAWDAVLTMFVLDCLTANDVRQVVRSLHAGLRPGGHWLFADFVEPARGWRRLRARLWIGLLYVFFRWRGAVDVTTLPPSEQILTDAGLTVVDAKEFQAGMVRTVRLRNGR